MKLILFFLLMSIFNTPFSLAENDSKRSKSLNFEDDMIEGINRKNLDSVNQMSEHDRRNFQHLYRKRASFDDLNQELAKEMRLKP